MRNRTILSIATALTSGLIVATPALAQSSEDQPFSGPYVAIQGGYDAQPNDVGEAIKFDRNLDGTFGDTITTGAGANAFSTGFCNGQARTNSPAQGCVNDRDSYNYGGRIGYDKQYGPIVVGAVIDGGYSNIRDAVSAFSTTPASYTINRKLQVTATARLRAGYAFDRTLFYATGGFAYARVNNYFRTTNTVNGFRSNGDSNAYGYAAGGGVEQKLNSHVSFGLEYLFNRLQNDDYRVRVSGGPATSPFLLGGAGGTDFARSYEKFRWHSVRAVLAYRF